jgi:acyl carrier protein phosphodiesterase
MNYLAHLYLASDNPDAMLGSLMGDFVKGAVDSALPPLMRASIIQHRRIDSFTDSHPIVMRSKQRLESKYRRYAGILIDMFYDHFLAREWCYYATLPLDEFTRRVYAVVAERQDEMPLNMQRTAHYLVASDLLSSYQAVAGIDRALKGVATRLSRPSPLPEASAELERLYNNLQEDFRAFLPELLAYVDLNEEGCVKPASEPFSHRSRVQCLSEVSLR